MTFYKIPPEQKRKGSREGTRAGLGENVAVVGCCAVLGATHAIYQEAKPRP